MDAEYGFGRTYVYAIKDGSMTFIPKTDISKIKGGVGFSKYINKYFVRITLVHISNGIETDLFYKTFTNNDDAEKELKNQYGYIQEFYDD